MNFILATQYKPEVDGPDLINELNYPKELICHCIEVLNERILNDRIGELDNDRKIDAQGLCLELFYSPNGAYISGERESKMFMTDTLGLDISDVISALKAIGHQLPNNRTYENILTALMQYAGGGVMGDVGIFEYEFFDDYVRDL